MTLPVAEAYNSGTPAVHVPRARSAPRRCWSGEVEVNDTAFAWNLDADYLRPRYDQRHRAAISFGYELPFGEVVW